MRERNVEFHFMLNEAEASQLRSMSQKAGLSMQAYLRALIHNSPIKEQPSADFFAVLKQLQQINNNMNQIAVKANAVGFVDAPAYRENAERLQDITAALLRAVMS